MKLLIDGDIVAFRSAAAAENDDVSIAVYYADILVEELMAATQATEYQIFLSGPGNFRYAIYPEYKANRIDKDPPRHRRSLNDYLQEHYKATVSDGCEADDLMGAMQTEDSIIASLDKDLLTIPGKHYQWAIKGKNWSKDARLIEMSETEANRWFYTQCITGDVADNIKGIPGKGAKFAEKLLQDCTDEQDMFNAVRRSYGDDDVFLMNARCLYIWRKMDDDYREHFARLSASDGMQ